MLGSTVLALAAVALLSVGVAAQEEKTKLICGFNSDADIEGLGFTDECDHAIVKDKELVTEGEGALKITAKKDDAAAGFDIGPAMPREKRPSGWEKFDTIAVDVNNLSKENVNVTLRFDDVDSKSYQTRANIQKSVAAGKSTVKVSLKDMKKQNGDALDVSKLKRFVLFFTAKASTEVVFDNLRLEKE
jgi:hypothetical protein